MREYDFDSMDRHELIAAIDYLQTANDFLIDVIEGLEAQIDEMTDHAKDLMRRKENLRTALLEMAKGNAERP